MNKKAEVKIVQSETKPVTIEIIATSIKAIADGVRKLRQGPLNDRAIYLLIQNASPKVGGRYGNQQVGMTEIRSVLEGMESLDRQYLKAKP